MSSISYNHPKLSAPPLPVKLISRTSLLARLALGLQSKTKVTLVTAPAGYGKTTLVAEWLARDGAVHAWITLDTSDNDPVKYYSCVEAALTKAGIEKIDKAIGAHLSSWDSLIAEIIENIHHPLVLVLDDYHVITNDEIHQGLERLVYQQPPNLHLVIISREDPPLPLAKMRARRQMTEVRVRDLRMDDFEVREFLSKELGREVPSEVADAFGTQTEGWAAGLQLVALSTRDLDDVGMTNLLKEFSGTHRYIIDYLADEVMATLGNEIRDFLVKTSVLTYLSAPLCDAVLDINDSKFFLEKLERMNLFIVPMDETRSWWRLHQLFRDVLVTWLPETEAKKVHVRAAAWFEMHENVTAAIKHAIKGGDMELASRLILAESDRVMERGEVVTLMSWLNQLPDSVIASNTDLAVLNGWTLLFTGQVFSAMRFLSSLNIEQLQVKGGSAVGRVAILDTWLKNIKGSSDLYESATRTLELISHNDRVGRCVALMPLGHAYLRRGELAHAIEAFREGYALSREMNHPFIAMTSLANLVFTLDDMGRLGEAIDLCNEGLFTFTDNVGKPRAITELIKIPLGCFLYSRNEVDSARKNLERGLDICRRHFSDTMMGGDGELALVNVYRAQGDIDGAITTASALREAAQKMGFLWSVKQADALLAELKYDLGDTEAAGAWSETMSDSVDEMVMCVRARLFIRMQRYGEAQSILSVLDSSTRQKLRHRRRITVLILSAMNWLAMGDNTAAMTCICEALNMAVPEGYIRLFIDEGTYILPVLSLASDTELPYRSFITTISSNIKNNTPTPSLVASPDLIEQLSEREAEILMLISEGLSNQEIAKKLYITEGTTKWHTHNIFGKLGVSRRTELIKKARELNLIS